MDPLGDSTANGSGCSLFLAYGNRRPWRWLVSGNFGECTFQALG